MVEPMPRGRVIVVGGSGALGSLLLTEARAAARPAVGTCLHHPGPGLVRFDCLNGRLADLGAPGPGDCVYLLSAMTAPDQVCDHPDEAKNLNVTAILRLADEALAGGARVVFVSTEYVFDGETGGYAEDATPNPTTLYGRFKVEAETRLLRAGGNLCILRTGLTVSPRAADACAVARTHASLLKPGARMAHDNVFSLTDAGDVARALLMLADAPVTGIVHCVASPEVSRTQLADWIIADSRHGGRMGYATVSWADIAFREPRPRRSFMVSRRLGPDLGLQPIAPRLAVRRKVALLDDAIDREAAS
ncbi:MAG: sugar nucleotide-binding protein [Alphaproteobacteria bacterium]